MPIPEEHAWQSEEDAPVSAGLSSFNLLDEKKFFSELALKPCMTLLDYGCGLGNYSMAAASCIGNNGKIYAFDPWEEGIETLEVRAAMAGFDQIHAAVCEPSRRLPVADREVDLCLMATVVHILEHDGRLTEALGEIKRVLSPNGMLAIVEFHRQEGPPGPPFSWRLSPERLVEIIGSNGFQVVRTSDVGPHNYLVSVQKRSFCPISALCSKNYPRNIRHMPAVIFFACLDLEQKSSFLDRHYLALFSC